MYAPTTRSQSAAQVAIATAMVRARRGSGDAGQGPGLSSVGDQALPKPAQCQALPTLVGTAGVPGGGAR